MGALPITHLHVIFLWQPLEEVTCVPQDLSQLKCKNHSRIVVQVPLWAAWWPLISIPTSTSCGLDSIYSFTFKLQVLTIIDFLSELDGERKTG